MSPTLRPSGEIVLMDKLSLSQSLLLAPPFFVRRRRRCGVDGGSSVGVERMRAALARQEAFVKENKKKKKKNANKDSTDNENDDDDEQEFWHERRISVSDLDPPTWGDLYQQLSTPLSVGDVVVVDHPSRRGTVCKRVAGLPGDTVLRPRLGLLVIPDGHVWLEGDNPVK